MPLPLQQPLYRWLRLVFSQNAYGFFLHIEFVLSITEFTFKMCNFPLLVGFVIAWIDYGNVAVVVTVLWLPSGKDRKVFAKDLKTIYQAVNEEKALEALDRVTEKWTPKYPNAMKRWKDNWDVISPIFKFSDTVRKVIYTTNAIESLNSTYRKLNRQRSVFPSDTALLKALYLATFEATKKWTMSIRNWGQVYGELSIMYEGRLPE